MDAKTTALVDENILRKQHHHLHLRFRGVNGRENIKVAQLRIYSKQEQFDDGAKSSYRKNLLS